MSGVEERVFPASRSRRQSLRRRGDVASPSWLQVGLPVAFWLWLLGSFGGQWFDQFRLALGEELSSTLSMSFDLQQIWERGLRVLVRLAIVASPIVVIPWITCVGLRLLQTRFFFSWETVGPDLERLSLLAGFRRIGASTASGNLGRTILQGLIAGGICLLVGWQMSGNDLAWPNWTAGDGMQGLPELGLKPIRLLGFSLLIVGLVDLAWQGFAYERRIRMTAQEVREELRNSERRSHGATGAGQVATEVQSSTSG